MGRKSIDLTGYIFNRLKVLKRDYNNQNKYDIFWLCECNCGNIISASGKNLRKKATESCGCLNKENFKINCTSLNTTHGLSKTRIYKIYKGMKQRCYNKNEPKYKNYGGRGITICNEWLDKENGFLNFYNWAMSNSYSDNLSIDRINNDGNYESNNCRWATDKEQQNNRRNNKINFSHENVVLES